MNNMKKLLLIFLVLVSFACYGQRIQKANTYGLAFNRTGADTLFYLPNDTFTVPAAYLTYPFMARKGANVYIWNTSSNVWQGLTGGTLDTTGAFVTSVYRRSDSVFYVKGGVHTFAFKDSTGGSIPTLQQVLTAGSTLTGNNTININNNDFIIEDGNTIQQSIIGGVNSYILLDGNFSRLYLYRDSILIQPSVGNFSIDTLNYTLSTTGKKILIRDTATGLVENIDPSLLGASSYTFTNGLTDSSGTVKLGGDLVDDTTTIIGNNKRFQIDSTLNIILISRNASFPADARILVSNEDGVMSRFDNSGDGSQLNVGQSINLITDNQIGLSAGDSILISSDNSEITLKDDTIKIKPGLGLLFIDTLTSAVGTKALRYNHTTGLVSYADTTSGGSTSPAGSTKQIQYNNAGAFGGAAGFEYQSGSSPNVTITGQNAAHVPLYVKGIGSTQTADLFRVMRYDDSAMFRIAANGSVTLGPPYDYVNAHHAPGHEFKYSNGGYTGGIKLRNLSSGSIVRLHTVNNGLYITDDAGSATPMTLGTRTNPADASTFIAASGVWTISAGRFGVGGTADASAIISATSTTKGFLPPKMTGTQAEAITSPAEGLMVYATDGSGSTITSKGWWGYDGSTWVKLN